MSGFWATKRREFVAHGHGQPEGAAPGADEKEIVATGEDGVGAGGHARAMPGQPDGEEGVQLARQAGHLGESGLGQAGLEDGAQVVHVALEGHQGLGARVAPAIRLRPAIVAGEVFEGLGFLGVGVEVALRQQARRVATGGPGVLLAKARDIGIDGPPGVAPEQGALRRHGQAEVPGPAQGAVLGGRAKAPAGLFVAGKLDVVTEQRQIEAGAQAGGRDQDPLTVNELLAHLDLVRRQGADMAPGVAQGLDRRGAAVDGALALGGIETVQEIGEDRRRRRVAAQVQPVGLGLVEGLEEAAH